MNLFSIFSNPKFKNLGTFVKITRAYGQFNFGVNLGQLKEGCDILIATTGRLMHLIKDKHVCLFFEFLTIFIVNRLICQN